MQNLFESIDKVLESLEHFEAVAAPLGSVVPALAPALAVALTATKSAHAVVTGVEAAIRYVPAAAPAPLK